MATSLMRSSTAFEPSNNYADEGEGINHFKGPNAITRGLGSIRPEGIKTNVSSMSVSYHDSETANKNETALAYSGSSAKKSSILDMGHFASTGGGKGRGLRNGRQQVSNDFDCTTWKAKRGGEDRGG